jgi:imidazole glycerol phosphate synthase glutamine amidotransferase subunit
MSVNLVGLVDYGAGNCTSVRNTISRLHLRSRLVKSAEDFNGISVLLIPGVGAFPSAMKALRDLDLIEPIRDYAHQGRPVIGVCLGMQLLADASHELGYTRGLELIPGDVKPITNPEWHIGWNTLEVIQKDPLVEGSDGSCFYFNHSYEFDTPHEYVIGIARAGKPIVSMVRRRNVCGFQFHPEKSQHAGLHLMEKTIEGLIHA